MKMKKLLIAIATLLFIAFTYLISRRWGPSIHADELLLTYWTLIVVEAICGVLTVGMAWVLARGLSKGRLGLGAIPLAILAACTAYSLVRLHTVIPRVLRLRNQVMDCQETNMGLIFQGIRRYWEDHDGRNPPGTGPHGEVTQADWRKVLLPYRDVWKGLKDNNDELFHLLKCPADKSDKPYSYEINPDLHSPIPIGHWVVRESWDPTFRYHQGYMGVLFQNNKPDEFYVMPILSKK